MKLYSKLNFICWLCSIIASIWIDHIAIDIITIITTLGFVFELIVEYKKSKSFKEFLRNNYIDILLLIPIFKVARMARLGKLMRMRKSLKILDAGNDVAEFLIRIVKR